MTYEELRESVKKPRKPKKGLMIGIASAAISIGALCPFLPGRHERECIAIDIPIKVDETTFRFPYVKETEDGFRTFYVYADDSKVFWGQADNSRVREGGAPLEYGAVIVHEWAYYGIYYGYKVDAVYCPYPRP